MININRTAPNGHVLASLRQVNNDIAAAQTRIGTGYRISGASGGGQDWTIAQNVRSGLRRQDAANDAMVISKARVDAAILSLDKINDLLTKIQSVSSNLSPTATGTVLASAQSEIKAYQTQINTAIQASGIQGRNNLTGASETVTTGSTASGAPIRLTVTGIDISAAGADFGRAVAAAMTNATTVRTIAGIATMALAYVADYRSSLANFSASIDTQLELQGTLTAIKQTALSSLVDTDMAAESAKVAALQVRQQLAYQSLAITNASPQNVLALFA